MKKGIIVLIAGLAVAAAVGLAALPYKGLFGVLLGMSGLGLFVCYFFYGGYSPDWSRRKYLEVIIPEELELFFQKRKPYLNPDYKISDLEKQMKVSRSAINLFTKKRFNRNFTQFLNLWRIGEVQRLQSLPENEGVSIYKLCLKAGFRDAQEYHQAEKERKAINKGKARSKAIVQQAEDEKIKDDLDIKKKPEVQLRI
jgi:AraC-like DNA-binding protein